MPHAVRNLLLILLFTALVGAHAVLMGRWILLDQTVGTPIYCDMLGPVSDLLRREALGGLTHAFVYHPLGGLAWFGLAMHHLTQRPDFLLWTILALMVATQVLLFDVGRRLESPLAGILAAALFPLYPDVALMGERWGSAVPHFFFLVAAADFLILSRSFNRILRSLGFILMVWVGMFQSAMGTDNLIFLAAAGSMALGAAARGLLLGRGPAPDMPTARWKTALIGTLVALPLGVIAWRLLTWFADVSYFQTELTRQEYVASYSRWSWQALTAYSRHLYQEGLSPLLAVPFLAGLALYLRRGRARAELLTWMVLPLLVLSVIGKKNSYYISVIYPVFPLVTVLGLRTLPWRPVGYLILAGILGLGGLQWVNRTLPDPGRPYASMFKPMLNAPFPNGQFPDNRGPGGPSPDAQVPDNRGPESPWSGGSSPDVPALSSLFQTELPIDLEPIPAFRRDREVRLLLPYVTPGACPEPTRVHLLANSDFDDLRLFLTSANPCLDLTSGLEAESIRWAGWVLLYDPRCGEEDNGWPMMGMEPGGGGDWEALRAQGKKLVAGGHYRLVMEDRSAFPCLQLLKGTPEGKAPPLKLSHAQRKAPILEAGRPLN